MPDTNNEEVRIAEARSMVGDDPKAIDSMVLSMIFQRHYIQPSGDVDNNDECVCGGWSSGAMEPGWDDHLGEVAVEAGFALSSRPPVPAESSEGVWTCGHCGRSSEAHGMPEHPAYQCVYAPVWKPLDPAPVSVEGEGDTPSDFWRDVTPPPMGTPGVHWECDCVPEYGPPHCHACGDSVGRIIAWTSTVHAPVSVEGEREALALAEYRAKIQDEDEAIQKIQRTDPFVIASIFNAGWQAHG